ncbi:MAG: hypothetical protein K2Z81_04230 [Cyanobacteria bacterium]|nr:hypothetical protein [Cyanobacteriota bacterium]
MNVFHQSKGAETVSANRDETGATAVGGTCFEATEAQLEKLEAIKPGRG